MSKIIEPNKELNKAPIRVGIAIPAGDEVKTQFMWSFSSLLMHTMRERKDIAIFRYIQRGTLLPSSRHGLVEAAMAADCTHVLWLDSDMTFPADTLVRLLEHREPIVAANYAKRRYPIVPTAERIDEQDHIVPLYTTEQSTGLEKVLHAGMGVMLVDMDVYRALPRPWFNLWYSKGTNEYAGEDVFFCYHAKHAGIDVLVDHDLSKEVGHLGEFEFYNQHADAVKEELVK